MLNWPGLRRLTSGLGLENLVRITIICVKKPDDLLQIHVLVMWLKFLNSSPNRTPKQKRKIGVGGLAATGPKGPLRMWTGRQVWVGTKGPMLQVRI